jgi:hypothetical protein
MVLLQFPEETLVGHAVFLQELLANLAVKSSYEIACQILINARFFVQSFGDLKGNSFDDLCSAGRIVQLPFDVTVRPGPESLRQGDNPRVDWSALRISGPYPERR